VPSEKAATPAGSGIDGPTQVATEPPKGAARRDLPTSLGPEWDFENTGQLGGNKATRTAKWATRQKRLSEAGAPYKLALGPPRRARTPQSGTAPGCDRRTLKRELGAPAALHASRGPMVNVVQRHFTGTCLTLMKLSAADAQSPRSSVSGSW
jgi:hypothetical protein